MSLSTEYLTTRGQPPDRSVHGARQSLIVVGNGPVGFSLIEKLCDKDVAGDWDLTVFGEEATAAYDRIRLTRLFRDNDPARLSLAGPQWYADRRITLHTGDPVISIDRDRQLVHSLTGRSLHYHRLVLVTGARPFVPPIPGIKQLGVFVYRTIQDVEQIRDFSQHVKSVVVLGSGLLGLEAAHAVHQMGLETHVVEMATTIMPKQLDNQAAEVLQEKLERLGLRFHLLHRTQEIQKHGGRFRILFDRRDSIDCEMIIVATGIRPRDELAHGCQLEVSPRGGIVVNDHLETSDPRIFALGECAVHRDKHYGLVAPGFQMADVLASRLTGHPVAYEGSDLSTRLKLLGIEVCTLGDYLESGADFEQIHVNSQSRYRKLILRKGRLVGAIFVGQNPELSRIHQAIYKRERLWIWHRKRFLRTGYLWGEQQATHISQWPASSIVCNCVHVTKEQLTTAEHEGCSTIEELCARTQAGTVCGSCRPLLLSLLGETTATEVTQKTYGLLSISFLTLALLTLWLILGPLPPAQSVMSVSYLIDQYLDNFIWKQTTGFIALGLVALGLTFSLRKRWPRLNIGPFGLWRSMHAAIGLVALVVVAGHTGLRFGENLSFFLIATFLLATLSGSLIGIVATRDQFATSIGWKQIRKYAFRLHLILFWPLPALVFFHILSVYLLAN